MAQQAAAQGISWLASSGDSGAAACDSDTLARAAQGKYASAYTSVVKLGKAVPADGEVPSLVYQLSAASGPALTK